MMLWIWGLTIAGLTGEILVMSRQGARRFGWLIPALLAALGLIRAAAGWLTGGAMDEYVGHSLGENLVSFLANLFLGCIPALAALLALAFYRLRRRWVKAFLVLAFLAVFPFFTGIAKDGGSRLYSAVLYDITFLHRLPPVEGQPYRTGTDIRLLHMGNDSRY